MKKIIIVFLFLVLITSLQAEEKIKSTYEKHLPKEVYLCCKKYQLIDENCVENLREQQVSNGSNHLMIAMDTRNGKQGILINFDPVENLGDDFIKIKLGYQNHKLQGYVVFDEEGLDYATLAPPPFSENDEFLIASYLIDKVFPIFEKR